MKRPVTAAVPVWNPQTPWSSSWNGARRAHGRLLSLCLALPLPCGWCLASSWACVTFYGHISCLGSGLWTSSKPMGSELISLIIGREKMWLAKKFKSTIFKCPKMDRRVRQSDRSSLLHRVNLSDHTLIIIIRNTLVTGPKFPLHDHHWPPSLITIVRWAVVTGCTGGIGRAYVLAMAAKGMDIVLVTET